MSEGLKALERIEMDMEYVTRLDFVEPIVRGEVQQELYKIYHREEKDLDIIKKELKENEQYKDIEEELGIDLIVFGKVLQALDRECIYVKIKETKQYDGYSLDEETGEIRRCVIVRFSRYINGLRDWFFTISWGDLSSTKQYLLKDYGKTWALTREELL